MSTEIRQVEGGWLWEVCFDDADFSGVCDTREEAEASVAFMLADEDGAGDDEYAAIVGDLEIEVQTLRARAETLEAEVERLTRRAADARREAFAEAIDLIEQRAVQRGRQVDVAQAEGGAWEVVARKSSELQAVADLLRRRLPALTPPA
jgi:hypothetical protein